jgi:hypothetical protein
MTRRWSALVAACLGILVAGSAHGQARNAPARDPGKVRPDPVAEHAAKLTEIDSWLRRLVGQYRLSLLGASGEGAADCASIGSGPGVHCYFGFGAPVMLFGVDTAGPRVHRFQLNGDSTAEMSMSQLRGDAVTFHVGDCPVIQHFEPRITRAGMTTFTVLSCRREARVHVAPDGRFVRIRHSTYERVLWRQPFTPSQIVEFPSQLNWTLERVQAP